MGTEFSVPITYFTILMSIVLRTAPLSLRAIIISASPLAADAREKLPLKEPLLRTFSQSALTSLPLLSRSVSVSVIGPEIVSVPAVQVISSVSVVLKNVV